VTLESIVDTYGYVAVLLGTFLEGETILVLGGFAAHRGYLALPWVIVAAFFGSLCGDQLFFFLGRKHSQAVLARRPAWKASADKANRLLERYRTPFILIFRFLYGLRSVCPFVIGMSSVPAPRFIFLNAIGAMVWSCVVGTGGYLFGSALEVVIGDVKRYEVEALLAIAVIGILVWTSHFYRRRKFATSSRSSQHSV